MSKCQLTLSIKAFLLHGEGHALLSHGFETTCVYRIGVTSDHFP